MLIDKQEVRRYLGINDKEADARTEALIDRCLLEASIHQRPMETHRTFPASPCDSGIFLDRARLILPGKSIKHHLEGCGFAVLMAATLGPAMDRLIHALGREDLARSMVMEAVATASIEAFCDRIEQRIRAEAAEAGLWATTRFSPGYGDLPLAVQPGFLGALDAHRTIGLSLTDSLLMTPRKSVTAVIGLSNSPVRKALSDCRTCSHEPRCVFRKEEVPCEHPDR